MVHIMVAVVLDMALELAVVELGHLFRIQVVLLEAMLLIVAEALLVVEDIKQVVAFMFLQLPEAHQHMAVMVDLDMVALVVLNLSSLVDLVLAEVASAAV